MADSKPLTPSIESKSQKKRNAQRMQKLGLALTKLNARQLDDVPLTAELTNSIAEYHRIHSNEAKRRQLQFIGKLMRETDVAAIEQALELIAGSSAQARYQIHQLERWRDRLVSQDAALTEYVSDHPTVDRPQLRQHIQRVRSASDEQQRRTAARALFRLLREHQVNLTEGNSIAD